MKDFKRSLAFLIAIDQYQYPVPTLETPVADAEAIALVLHRDHGFETKVIPDKEATLARLRSFLSELPSRVGKDDRVFFYFAGHGVADEGNGGPEGFLLPQDAKRDFREGFLSMADVHRTLASLPCRHVLVMLDCCFAGAFRWAGTRDLVLAPQPLYQERYDWYIQGVVKQAIASAAHDERALDVVVADRVLGKRDMKNEETKHSPFAEALIRGLQGEADIVPKDGDGVITATELYLYLEQELRRLKHLRQTPILWQLPDHKKGEFVFLVPGSEHALPSAPVLDKENNPWSGLRPYIEKQSDLFFGRDQVSKALLSQIQANAFVVVIGPSGIGKSSLVQAGILSKLPDNDIHAILVRPGTTPFATLETALRDDPYSQEPKPITLDAWVRQAEGNNVRLLVIDQVEELVTMNRDPKIMEDYLALLATTLKHYQPRFKVLLTLRADFEPLFTESPLAEWWASAKFYVPQMTDVELRQVIEGPAAVQVIQFDPKPLSPSDGTLVDVLVREVRQMPGALPLLSFALREMYKHYLTRHSVDRMLTYEDYEALKGGVTGSLQLRANQLIEKHDEAYKATARRVLARLVSVETGEFARRRVSRQEFMSGNDQENAQIKELIDEFIVERIIVTDPDGKDYIEFAHDALISSWKKLRNWVTADMEVLQARRRLTPVAEAFERSDGKEHKNLWADAARCSQVKKLYNNPFPGLNIIETRFAEASIQRAKRNNFIRGLAITVLVLLTIGVSSFWYMAEQQAMISDVQRMVEKAQAVFKNFPQESVLLAVEAAKKKSQHHLNIPAVDIALQNVLLGNSGYGIPSSIFRYVISPNSRWLVTKAKLGKSVSLWDLKTVDPASSEKVLESHTSWIIEMAISPDSHWLVTASIDGMILLWDLCDKNPSASVKELKGHTTRISEMAISPDSHWLVTRADTESIARRWDLRAENPKVKELKGHRSSIKKMKISPDSHWLLTGSRDGTVRQWFLAVSDPGARAKVLAGHRREISELAISSDSRWLVTSASGERTARRWDLWKANTSLHMEELHGHISPITRMAISPDGRWLVTSAKRIHKADKNKEIARRWELAVVDIVASMEVLSGDEHPITHMAISPDSHWLVISSKNGIIRRWHLPDMNLASSQKVSWGNESIKGLVISPDSRWLVARARHGKSVRRWDLAATDLGASEKKLFGHDKQIIDMAISSDSHWLVTWTDTEKAARLWDLKSKEPAESSHVMLGHDNKLGGLTISPDSHWLFAHSMLGPGRIWDLSTSDPSMRAPVIEGHGIAVSKMAMSLDNHWLVTGSRNGIVRRWNLQGKDRIPRGQVAREHKGRKMEMVLSSDSRWLVTQYRYDRTARLWNLNDKDFPASVKTLGGVSDLFRSS